MRIALDATYSLDPELTGIGVYSRRLLEGLAAARPECQFRWCYRSHRWLGAFQQPTPPANCWRGLLLDSGVRRAGLFHGLNQRLPRRTAVPAIATFHDLFVMTGEYSTPEFRQRFTAQARAAADRADWIIAVSEFTATQVHDLLGVSRGRIRVVPHGTDRPAAQRAGVPREPIILHVGALQKRKNLVRLIEAFGATPPGWRLALLGGDGYGCEQVHAAVEASTRRADILTPGYVSAAELTSHYQRASIFAFPSLDEGYGIPVLEAMAWGLPVVTSQGSALPEAAGGAAWLVDPLDTGELAGALQRLCQDEDRRAAMAAAGLARVETAGWGEAVAKTWSVYQEALAMR